MSVRKDYWFPAKRYGWGWGPPMVWQGWIILVAWAGLLIVGATRLLPAHPLSFLALTLILSALLTLVCYLKGEPPKWRWGDRDDRRP